jgi:hypothetical protein
MATRKRAEADSPAYARALHRILLALCVPPWTARLREPRDHVRKILDEFQQGVRQEAVERVRTHAQRCRHQGETGCPLDCIARDVEAPNDQA